MALAKKAKIESVQIDGSVLLKIVKHCKENLGEVVTGQLLGYESFETSGRLDITQCFALPSEGDLAKYSQDMMDLLRLANYEANIAGWYLSSYQDSFSSKETIEQQFEHQQVNPKSVCLVHDPSRTNAGKLSIKAYRLKDRFFSKYVSEKGLTGTGFTQDDVFEELPIKVHNSLLVHGFLYELREQKSMSCDSDRLVFNQSASLEKDLNSLGGLIDTYINEHGRLLYHYRQASKLKAQQEDFIAKMNEENKRRKEMGLPVIPREEWSNNPILRPLPPHPDITPDLLRSKQMSLHCENIISVSSQSFDKLYSLEALQKFSKY